MELLNPPPIAGLFLVGMTSTSRTVVSITEYSSLFESTHRDVMRAALERLRSYFQGIVGFEIDPAPVTWALSKQQVRSLASLHDIRIGSVMTLIVCYQNGQSGYWCRTKGIDQQRLEGALAEVETCLSTLIV